MSELFQFYADPRNNLLGETIAFLELCFLPILISTTIGVTVGILVSRNPVSAFIAVNLSDLMRAVPVLAVLFIFVPIFGVGFLPAVIALTILGIPPVLLNTYTGIRGVSPAIIDSARGMGMTSWQIVSKIQAPLVLPVVAAGVRTSAVQIVATATLGALIGAGGYGNYIVDGVNLLNDTEIIAGALLVAAVALIVEVGMGWLEKRITPEGLRVQPTNAPAIAPPQAAD